MAWVAVDQDGSEVIYESCPNRYKGRNGKCDGYFGADYEGAEFFDIPQGSIEKLIGRKLTWEDEPVELK